MMLRMSGLRKVKSSGEFVARKGIPADVRDAYAKLYGQRWEAKLRIPAGTPDSIAKARHGEWLAEQESRIEALRAAASGRGQPLTRVQALALAGGWYRWYLAQHEADPGLPSHWSKMHDHLVWDVLAPHAPDEHLEDSAADPEWEWRRQPDVREAVRPLIAEEARVASYLASEGLALTSEAYALFVDAVCDNLLLAYPALEARARGDYTPDETPQQFPPLDLNQRSSGDSVTPWSLFEAWVNAARPAPATVSRWRVVFTTLTERFPDARALPIKDAKAWLDGLITEERSATTVRDIWLNSAKRVFGWSVEQHRLMSNPFDGLKLTVPRKTRTRETEAFTDAEAATLLRAALAVGKPKTTFEGAKRWCFWIAAYTGARMGEVTQLRGLDVQRRGDNHVAKLTPDAGTIKTRQARVVPLHEHLIAQGFLEFVNERGDGPLFYNEREEPEEPDVMKPRITPATKARQRLGDWARELGVDDPEVSPTHGWRHTFKQRANRVGITEKTSDAITGHVPITTARKYGIPTTEDMAEALKNFPRYALE